MSPREPRLRISVGGRIVYEMRLDQLLRIEGYFAGRAPEPLVGGLTFELLEGKKTLIAQSYTPADFPQAGED